MCMHVDQRRITTLSLDPFHEVVGWLRLEKPRHVFNADGIATHLYKLFGHFDERRDRVDRRNCVADGSLRVLPRLLYRLYRCLQIADIIQCVEDAEDVHAIFGSACHETFDYTILIMAVAK